MNKQQLANKIWESANKMRSKIEANEYKDYILGFIFYKFLSDKEVQYLKSIGYTDDDINTVTDSDTEIVDSLKENIGYFISYDNLFSTWVKKGSDFEYDNVTDALSAFNSNISHKYSKVFEGIFKTLDTGLSKLGDTASTRKKAISDLIHLIKDIPMDGRQDYDVLGFIYEYLISNFAANAGKKAGEFYTPHEVSLLMSEIIAEHLRNREKIRIYDPTSGSGSLLINIGKCASKYMSNSNGIKYYAQELKENTYNLTRMNLVMRGIIPDNIVTKNNDTLEEDWPLCDDGEAFDPLYVDAVVSNPPYSQTWSPDGKESDPRFKSYGLAPKSKADYAFLLHSLYHVKPDGIMTIVLPHGVLFRGGEEGKIRENLIENNNIDAIIGLPPNIFFGTGIPTIIMVLRQKRDNSDVLIIDASKGFEKSGKDNKLRACDIKKIVDVVKERKEVAKYSVKVSRDEIRSNGYNLNIPRYVDSAEKPESWDIYASMFGGIPSSELDEMADYWEAFPNLRKSLFPDDGAEYVHPTADNIKSVISAHPDITEFTARFRQSLTDLAPYLKKELVDRDYGGINISKEESVLSDDIFSRLKNVPLVDVYEAYQILDNEWNKIAIDLEIIQTEGFEATKQPDYILPVELVQSACFGEELASIQKKENRLSEISSEYETLLDSLSEEEKQGDFVNEDKTAFVAAEVKKALKAKDAEPNVIAVLKEFDKLSAEEKELKKKIKSEKEDLARAAIKAIETMSDEKAREMLGEKWITPIVSKLSDLSECIVNTLITKLTALLKKYETTFNEIDGEMRETEKQLCGMIDRLTGNSYDMQGLGELKKHLGGV